MLLSADSCKEAVKVAAMVLRLCKDGRQLLKICAAFHVTFPDKIIQCLNLSDRNGKGRGIKKTDNYAAFAAYPVVTGFLTETQRMGFEPMRPCGQTVFKTASL